VETPADGARGGPGRVAVFSMREGLQAIGEHAEATTDAGAAMCRLPLPSSEGRHYQLRVWTEREGWWAAAVGDHPAAHDTVIGRILVPDHWRRLGTVSTIRTEYRRRPLQRCDDLPACTVVYRMPTADGGRVQPERHESRVGPGTCEGSRVETVADGVRHAMGGPS
jgi:hypothetical protein